MEKFFGFIGFLLVVLLCAIPLTFLKAHILMDVSTLWELEFITSLGYTKIIGLMSITTIYTLNAKKNPEEDKLETIGEHFGYFIGKYIKYTIMLMIGWGMSYLIHLFV
jgi:hypothetical protein